MTIEEAFTAELQALLDKYDADLYAEHHEHGWANIKVEFQPVRTGGKILRRAIIITLGGLLRPTPKKPTGA